MSGRSIAVVSGKGGAGKSMLVTALGAQWAFHRKRVLLVDLNTGMRGLDMLLGLESRVVFDLGDVLDGMCGAEQAILSDSRTGMRLLAARQISDTDTVNAQALSGLVKTLAEDFDVVLLDAPGGLGKNVRAAVGAAQEALLVTTPDDAALRDAERAAGLLSEMDVRLAGLVLNRIRPEFVEEGLQYTPEVCSQVLDVRVAGVIPDDREVWRRMLARQPINGDFPAAWAVRNLMERLEDSGTALRSWRGEEQEMIKRKKGFLRRGQAL